MKTLNLVVLGSNTSPGKNKIFVRKTSIQKKMHIKLITSGKAYRLMSLFAYIY